MRFLRYFTAFCILTFTTLSCNKSGEQPVSDNVLDVRIDTEFNALRVLVDIDLKRPDSYSLKYWMAVQNESEAKTTKIYEYNPARHSAIKYIEADTDYKMRVVLSDGTQSKVYSFRTCSLPKNLPDYTVMKKVDGDWMDGYIFQSENIAPGYVTMCDYNGHIVWYQAFGDGIRTMYYDPATGYLAASVGFKHMLPVDVYRLVEQIVVVDLDGNEIFRRKVCAEGDFLNDVHHEFCINHRGEMCAISASIRQYDGRDVWGDCFNVFDFDGNKKFYWDHWSDFNPDNQPWYEEIRDKAEYDYIHANAVYLDSNEDYYVCFNYLNEIWKLDGKTGNLLYRFGEHGDIALTGEPLQGPASIQDPSKFITGGMHAVVALEPDYLLFYANGEYTGVSQAVFVKIDASAKTATYERIVDIPKNQSSANRSNVQLVGNGDRLFFCNSSSGRVSFVDLNGNVLRVLGTNRIAYRGYYFGPQDVQ